MADLEKVLNGLEHCIKKLDSVIDNTHGFDCISCSYFRKCESIGHLVGLPLMLDALTLLKAQQPRVLTPEEVQALQNNDVVWLEDKGKPKIIPGIVKSRQLWPHSVAMVTNFIRSDGCTVTGGDEDCGKRWRCWNKRPTDEQRKAVKWDD